MFCFVLSFSTLPISKYETTNYLDNKAQQDQSWKPTCQLNESETVHFKATPNNYTEFPEGGEDKSSLVKPGDRGSNGHCQAVQDGYKTDGEREDDVDSESSKLNDSAVFENPVSTEEEGDPADKSQAPHSRPSSYQLPGMSDSEVKSDSSLLETHNSRRSSKGISNHGFEERPCLTPIEDPDIPTSGYDRDVNMANNEEKINRENLEFLKGDNEYIRDENQEYLRGEYQE